MVEGSNERIITNELGIEPSAEIEIYCAEFSWFCVGFSISYVQVVY